MAMIRSAPFCFAERTARRPTAPSPTTATVMPGFTLAASFANQPVPRTSEVARRCAIISLEGTPGAAQVCHPQEERAVLEPVRHLQTLVVGRQTGNRSCSEGTVV